MTTYCSVLTDQGWKHSARRSLSSLCHEFDSFDTPHGEVVIYSRQPRSSEFDTVCTFELPACLRHLLLPAETLWAWRDHRKKEPSLLQKTLASLPEEPVHTFSRLGTVDWTTTGLYSEFSDPDSDHETSSSELSDNDVESSGFETDDGSDGDQDAEEEEDQEREHDQDESSFDDDEEYS